MTEPLLIASALLAIGRMISKGQEPNAIANGPAGPPPFELPPAPPPVLVPTPAAPPSVPAPPRRAPKPQAPRPQAPPPVAPRVAVVQRAPEPRPGPSAPPTRPPEARAAPPVIRAPEPRDQGPPLPGPAGGAPPGPVVKDSERLDRAAEAAKAVAADLKRRSKAYDRKALADFQKLAGLEVDGVYGPRSAGAIRWYTGESIPPLTGKGFVDYAPKF